MEKRNNQNKIVLAECPRCKAMCLKGHDEDGQIMCAKCTNSFKPKVEISMTADEYKEFAEKAIKRHEKVGWTAFTIN